MQVLPHVIWALMRAGKFANFVVFLGKKKYLYAGNRAVSFPVTTGWMSEESYIPWEHTV